MSYQILNYDPILKNYEEDINLRMDLYKKKHKELVKRGKTLSDFANGHHYFGIHRTEDGWVYREWAPGAEAMYLTGDFNQWNLTGCPMQRLDGGVFQVELQGRDALIPGQKIQAIVIHDGQMLRRIPLYATRVVQDPDTIMWCAEVEDTLEQLC